MHAQTTAPTIRVVPATPDRWPDVEAVLGDIAGGEHGCWCQYWRQSASAYRALGPGGARRELRRQVDGDVAPGVLAYVGNEPAGWCGLWPRSRFERLVRSRTIPAVDDVPVWSIVCFLVRVGCRRRGVARALLEGAVSYARKCGAPAIEAYPIDPGDRRASTTFGYVGFVRMFRAAGFQEVCETAARSDSRPRILMRLDLREACGHPLGAD